jgi:hypothetical protein
MPRKLELWSCSVCGKSSKTEEGAMCCESAHLSYKKEDIEVYFSKSGFLPDYLTIKGVDNTGMLYTEYYYRKGTR